MTGPPPDPSADRPAEPPFAVDTPAGFVAFYRASVGEVHRYLSRLAGGDRALAEDLTQEAFLALARQAGAGRVTRVDVGWVIVAGRRRFLDHIRSQGREARRLEQVAVEVVAPAAEPDWSTVDPHAALAQLGRLPEDQRTALVLRYVDDLSTAAVATQLDRSVAATESLLARARRELARLVSEARRG